MYEVKLALEMSKLVHDECKDVPHDIGLRLLEIVKMNMDEQLRKHGVVGLNEQLKCGNSNPPCAPNIKFGYLECMECDWSE